MTDRIEIPTTNLRFDHGELDKSVAKQFRNDRHPEM